MRGGAVSQSERLSDGLQNAIRVAQRHRYPPDFSALVQRPTGMDLRELTPNSSAALLDLADRDDGDLGADRPAIAPLRILKHIRAGSPAELPRAFGGVVEAVVTSLWRARQGRSARGILAALPEGEARRQAMTIAESLERKGRRKGRLEGGLEEKREVLARLVDRKFGLTESERKLVQSHTNADELDAAIDAIVSARSKGQVLKHLR